MVAASIARTILMERNASCAKKDSSKMNMEDAFPADATLMEANLNSVMILANVTVTMASMEISVIDVRIIFTILLVVQSEYPIK